MPRADDPRANLLTVHAAARVRVERPELFDTIEVAAAESWMQTHASGGIQIRYTPAPGQVLPGHFYPSTPS